MSRAAISLAASFLLSATPAAASVLGVAGVTLDPQPTTDLVFSGADDANGDPISLNSGNDPDPDITLEARITSITTGAGEVVSSLSGPSRIGALETELPGDGEGDLFRNVFGAQRAELDGPASLLGADLSAGVDNAPFIEVFFDRGIVGTPGEANDLFLFDLFGDDSIFVQALDASGDVIDGTGLAINSGPGENNFNTTDTGDFGDIGFDLALLLEANQFGGPDTIIDDVSLAGVGFDIEDLFGALAFETVFGLAITGTTIGSGFGTIDLLAAVANNAALSEVPVPGALLLFGTALAGFGAARGRSRVLSDL